MKKVIIAGGTGFIGSYLARRYATQGCHVVVIGRTCREEERNISYAVWDGKTLDKWAAELDGADVLINLAGKSVNCRYNETNKREIYDSRTGSTQVLGEAIQQCKVAPKLWINSSTATIYRHAEDRPQDEESGEIGKGFSVDVARAWEKAFFNAETPETRKVALRISITLGPNGGVMIPYRNLTKMGFGGKQGNGRQMFSWLHIEDLARIIDFVEESENLEGVYNATSPNPVNNSNFTAAMRKAYDMSFGLPASKLMLELGAMVIHTETELVLKSRWVVPTKLLDAGFQFQYPQIDEALQHIVAVEAE